MCRALFFGAEHSKGKNKNIFAEVTVLGSVFTIPSLPNGVNIEQMNTLILCCEYFAHRNITFLT